MKRLNLSLLGLMLLMVSAAVAAVLPYKSNDKRVHDGTLRVNSGLGGVSLPPNAWSCVTDDPDDTFFTCSKTNSKSTDEGGTAIEIDGLLYQTAGNTSVGANANSVLQRI